MFSNWIIDPFDKTCLLFDFFVNKTVHVRSYVDTVYRVRKALRKYIEGRLRCLWHGTNTGWLTFWCPRESQNEAQGPCRKNPRSTRDKERRGWVIQRCSSILDPFIPFPPFPPFREPFPRVCVPSSRHVQCEKPSRGTYLPFPLFERSLDVFGSEYEEQVRVWEGRERGAFILTGFRERPRFSSPFMKKRGLSKTGLL